MILDLGMHTTERDSQAARGLNERVNTVLLLEEKKQDHATCLHIGERLKVK